MNLVGNLYRVPILKYYLFVYGVGIGFKKNDQIGIFNTNTKIQMSSTNINRKLRTSYGILCLGSTREENRLLGISPAVPPHEHGVTGAGL